MTTKKQIVITVKEVDEIFYRYDKFPSPSDVEWLDKEIASLVLKQYDKLYCDRMDALVNKTLKALGKLKQKKDRKLLERDARASVTIDRTK
ncbi:MAG: hypothetical protein HY865_22500 [Chloroflexi bacterium]|nr:hypothetical protein [Chloroflexota bacterium]